ncbi:MAG: Uma2 family endonuclease [Acidimicrobiales bacterium]
MGRGGTGSGTRRHAGRFPLRRNIYAPDAWWVCEERKPRPGDLDLDGLPDIVVEVRSPSTWRYDLGKKRRRYEESGIAELWFVDTASQSLLVYRRTSATSPTFDVELEPADDDVVTSPLLPGFALRVTEVFRI